MSKKKKNGEVRWIREEKKKRRKKEGKQTGGGKKRNQIERERETKMEIFPVFQRSKLDCLRRKVDPCIESYTWVPKSWSFVKLHEVGIFLLGLFLA